MNYSYKNWILEVEARGLKTEDQTGYTEDMNGCVHLIAVNSKGEEFGCSYGSPVQETESVLFNTPDEFTRWQYEGSMGN